LRAEAAPSSDAVATLPRRIQSLTTKTLNPILPPKSLQVNDSDAGTPFNELNRHDVPAPVLPGRNGGRKIDAERVLNFRRL